MDVFKDLYQQLIIDHNQSPRNFRKLENASHCAEGHNPLCGDEITVTLIEKEGIIDDIAFIGSGCAISKASASIMTSTLKGMTVQDGNALFDNFHILNDGRLYLPVLILSRKYPIFQLKAHKYLKKSKQFH